MAFIVVNLATLAALLLAFAVWLYQHAFPRPLPGIPYNASSARRILGDIPDLVPLVSRTREQAEPLFTITTRRLRTPLAQVLFPRFFRRPLVVVEDPREIEDIMMRRNAEFDKAPLFMDVMGTLLPRATISMYTGHVMKTQRRLWQDTMKTDFLRRAAGSGVYGSTLELIELWRLKATTRHKDELFDVHEDLENTALDAVWVVLAGIDSGLVRHEVAKLRASVEGRSCEAVGPRGEFVKDFMKYMSDTMGWIPQTPVPRLATILEKLRPRYRRHRGVVEAEIRAAMRRTTERFEQLGLGEVEGSVGGAEAHDTCALDLVLRRRLVSAKKAGVDAGDATEDAGMVDEMLSFLIGAHDSTATSLSWFLKFMGTYAKAQQTLRGELRAVFPGPGLPSHEEIIEADIPYLDAAVEESFRLAGTAKAGLRQALVDTEVLGHPIPRGTELLLNLHVNGTPPVSSVDEERRSASSQSAWSRRNYGRDRLATGLSSTDLGAFEPRRWLARDSKTGKDAFDAYALTSLPFGGGPRGCFGRKLAYMEFRTTITLLVLSFEFRPLPPELTGDEATETIFRAPEKATVLLRVLE